jgi:transcriptional regulator with XRE-family HTH domain
MKLYRTAIGMSQQELARRVGRAQSFISDVETGVRAPIPELASRIARVLKTTPAELFGDVVAARKKGASDEARRG